MKTVAIKVYFGTCLAWLAVCASYAWLRIGAYLSSPMDGDQYAHTWSFQLLNFLIFRLPIWLLGLVAVLFVEMIVLRIFGSSKPGGVPPQ
jgi:hypothetical protein